MRIFLHIVLPLVAAAASLANLAVFRLNRLMDPAFPAEVTAALWAGAALVVAAVVASLWAMRGRRAWVAAIALVVIVAAGFAPRAADMAVAEVRQAEAQKEGAEAEMEFQMALLDWSDDVAARIAERRPMTAEEGLAFLEFAAGADLSWRSLPDHSKEAFALVSDALDAGILDPDALTTRAPVADSPAITLALMFYEKHIAPGSPRSIAKADWQLLQMLMLKNPDLSAEDAAPLRADLGRTPVIGDGRFIHLE